MEKTTIFLSIYLSKKQQTSESGHTAVEKLVVYSLGWGFPGGSVVRNLPADAGDMSWIPGSGRSPRGGNGNPLQDSCLGNPMDREGC